MQQPKWEVCSDEAGNFYFYNHLTGESTWELPAEEEDATDNLHDDSAVNFHSSSVNQLEEEGWQHELVVQAATSNPFVIAVTVIDTMMQVLDLVEESAAATSCTKAKKKKKFVTPAAEIRYMKNLEKEDKKRKRLREQTLAKYMNILAPPTSNDNENDKGAEKPRQVGTLFSSEDTQRWRLEQEIQHIRQRKVIRNTRKRHQKEVYARMNREHTLKQFRTDLLHHFLAQIECSTELQKQRILLLSAPQQLADMSIKQRKLMEPVMAEKFALEEQTARENKITNTQKVFVLVDEAKVGRVHLLQLLFAMTTIERAQQYAMRVRGLAELLNSMELQRFLVDFVSKAKESEYLLSMQEFVEFSCIVEEVVNHYMSVKNAVEDAENDIEATLQTAAASPGMSVVQARMGILSKRKIEQEMMMLKATEDRVCQAQRDAESDHSFHLDGKTYLEPKEEWEKNHHHRYIRFDESLPLYCCLCRRRKWEIARREHEELESKFRSRWSTVYSLKVKSEELKMLAAEDNKDPGNPLDTTSTLDEEQSTDVHDSSTTKHAAELSEEDIVVMEVMKSLVTMTERMLSEEHTGKQKPNRRVHQKPPRRVQPRSKLPKNAKRSAHDFCAEVVKSPAEVELQRKIKEIESEEQERKALYGEELFMMLFLERTRRRLERPLLQFQDSAHNAYIRMLEHCVNPAPLLYRLQFDQCLAYHPPQQLVLQMTDGAKSVNDDGINNNYLILQTAPCRTEQEGMFIHKQTKILLDHLRSEFAVQVVLVAKHTFQLFAQSGMLVECWPIVFTIVEYFPRGSWLERLENQISASDHPLSNYANMELHVWKVLRQVSAGLSAMHSRDVWHLNISISNIYLYSIENDQDVQDVQVKLGGLLAWKAGFDENQLATGQMEHCVDFTRAPPEMIKHQPVNAKADVWMLGCALYELLMLWQRHQLQGLGHPAQSGAEVVIHLKSIQDILQEIPIAASSQVRSLLRMMLQPNPAQRPSMSQIVDYLSFSSNRSVAVGTKGNR